MRTENVGTERVLVLQGKSSLIHFCSFSSQAAETVGAPGHHYQFGNGNFSAVGPGPFGLWSFQSKGSTEHLRPQQPVYLLMKPFLHTIHNIINLEYTAYSLCSQIDGAHRDE